MKRYNENLVQKKVHMVRKECATTWRRSDSMDIDCFGFGWTGVEYAEIGASCPSIIYILQLVFSLLFHFRHDLLLRTPDQVRLLSVLVIICYSSILTKIIVMQ